MSSIHGPQVIRRTLCRSNRLHYCNLGQLTATIACVYFQALSIRNLVTRRVARPVQCTLPKSSSISLIFYKVTKIGIDELFLGTVTAAVEDIGISSTSIVLISTISFYVISKGQSSSVEVPDLKLALGGGKTKVALIFFSSGTTHSEGCRSGI
ncbi:hypothetical protein DFH07DRAFT_16362 [Mycena maculata]|uniref:Uncharacterized protein n=1 Tax=Mycena maculata TaxID=230809 RepID=A0AAD7IKR2_9AGAR|nr:hypothetical protein DFH07DRAFT_16362 [Mycena maculata]